MFRTGPRFNQILASIATPHGHDGDSVVCSEHSGGGLMPINQYRRRAVECLRIADENTVSPESRMLLVGMAQAWLKLAQRAEQNPSAEIVSEKTSPPIVRAA